MVNEQIVEKMYSLVRRYGLVSTLYVMFGKRVNIKIGYSKKCCDAQIEDLSLSVRSYNALKRAQLDSVGKVIDSILENSIMKIRNLGTKSLVEIQTKITEYGFEHLDERDKKEFLRDILTVNNT